MQYRITETIPISIPVSDIAEEYFNFYIYQTNPSSLNYFVLNGFTITINLHSVVLSREFLTWIEFPKYREGVLNITGNTRIWRKANLTINHRG